MVASRLVWRWDPGGTGPPGRLSGCPTRRGPKTTGVASRSERQARIAAGGPVNWFGEVSTNDYKEYTIKNKNFVLKNGTNYPVRFYIKYDVNIKPKLISIAFNNKLICPEPAENAWEDGNFPDDFALTNQSRAGLREICGTVIARPIPLITYGTTAIEGEYPWHAAVYHVKDFKMTYICGGSLITHNFIITVAHCVTKAKTVETFLPVNIVTFLGKYYLQQFSNPGMQEHPTVEIVIHPGFNPYSFANDISLIQLKRNARFTDYVRPICLWQDSINVTEILNQNGKIVGWGYNEAGKITDQLMEITMPVVSQEMCLASFPQFYTRFTSDNTYCAGFRNGSSVCNESKVESIVRTRFSALKTGDAAKDYFVGDFLYIKQCYSQINIKHCGTILIDTAETVTLADTTTLYEGKLPCRSLISNVHILTSSSCPQEKKKKKNDYTLGSVYKIIAHPNEQNDIAAIRSNSPIDITNYARPLCILQMKPDVNEGIIIGWKSGKNSGSKEMTGRKVQTRQMMLVQISKIQLLSATVMRVAA
ncbi:hypothetical protein FQA39_LY17391 [Lamprigera yunnana]|nr:hypothetical protein FQA39_LY17391 [Lamprigera yunnana]